MTNPIAVDLSHWQDQVDFDALAANGTVAVILKCTEGQTYLDPTFHGRYAAAKEAGLAVSSYHFLRPGDMVAQMDWYLSQLQPDEGDRVCLDHEDAGVSLDDLVIAVKLLKEERPDLQIAIYSGHVIKDQLGSKTNAELALNTDLWLAQYTEGEPSWPMQVWPEWSLWQYSDKADAVGVDGPVDGNKWQGTDDELRTWMGQAPEPPPEREVPPPPTAMAAGFSLPIGQPYQIYVNGTQVCTGVA